MSCGASLITLGFIFANERKFHPTVTGSIRGFTALVIGYLISRWKSIDLTYGLPNNFKWQMIRCSIMTLQGLVYAWSLFYLPVPIVVTMYAATPIFTAIWDYLIFGSTINHRQKGWLALAFVGVLLTTNGRYLESILNGQALDSEGHVARDPFMELIAGVILATSQFIHGLGLVFTKNLTQTNTIHIIYAVGFTLLFSNSIFVNFVEKSEQYHWPDMYDLF